MAAAALLTGLVFGPALERGAAVEVPPAGAFYVQTSGANAAVTIGDWYSSTTAGAGSGYHYLSIEVPCGWPSATPLYIDLFSPEINAAGASLLDEPRSSSDDSTEFELYGPGATIGPGYASPAAGAGTLATTYPAETVLAETWVRYATLDPVICGSYVVRSAVIGEANDDNGWRIRVGTDDNGDPNDAPPTDSDDPDGQPGTNDEIVIGQSQITYQHSAGGVACLTVLQFVSPLQASVTFHNFDMDNNTRVRYYAPSDVYDATGLTGGTVGTLSGNGTWNGGTIARGGDTIANPETGWWRIVSCLSSTNQFIQEGQAGVGLYFSQPPTPVLAIAKTDGVTVAPAGGDLTYIVTVTNTSSGPTAGAANAVVVTDTIPVNSTFVSCSVVAPATGICTEGLGVVTATLDDWIAAGDSADVEVTVTVDADATGTVSNDASVVFEDALGNPFPEVTASDVDTAGPPVATPTPIPSVPDAGINTGRGEQGAIAVIGAAVGIVTLGLLGLASLAERRQRRPPRRPTS